MKGSYTYKPVQFFLITNSIMWASWLTAARLSYRPDGGPGRLISVLELVGFFSPFVTALWMIFTSKSAELKRNCYEKLIDLRLIKLWSIPAILLLMPAAAVVSIVLSHLFFGQSLGQLAIVKTSPFIAGMIPLQLLSFAAPLFEETGWRSYGVDSLRGNRTFFTATLIFGSLWAFWHCALFLVNNYYHNTLLRTNPLFALNFIVSLFPVAIIINWLWYSNEGSILTPVVFHAVANLQWLLQMGQIATCIETVVLIVTAMTIVGFNKEMFFSEFSARIGYFGQKIPSS